MQGQWMGRFSGTNDGVALLEMDRVGSNFEGRIYLFNEDHKLPSAVAFVRVAVDRKPQTTSNHSVEALHPVTLDAVRWETLQADFPTLQFPSTATAEWDWNDNSVDIKWTTNLGASGKAILERMTARRPSDLTPLDIHTWDDFRRRVRDFEPYRYIYRGQESNDWRLCTAFHRSERSDLIKFLAVDVPTLQQHLSSLTAHFFDLRDPLENAAFISLAQHHGYPTPLLDWTFSPFIGAYFAFKRAQQTDGKVRIFIFDAERWRHSLNQVQKLAPARPHFSILNPISINNMRSIPQQALSSVTNVNDIEEYIRSKETSEVTFLQAVDLPVSERLEALQELSMMGINAGSLFPGLDGACDQLKDRLFGF